MFPEQIGLEAVLETTEFVANSEEYNRTLDEMGARTDEAGAQISESMDGAGFSITSMGLAAGAAVVGGVGLLVGGISDVIGEASESELAMSKVEAMIKATGGAAGITAEEANAMASGIQAVSMYSDEAALAGEAVLLKFQSIGEDVFPNALQASVDLAAVMGTEPAAAAQMLGRALESPTTGLAALKRAGVIFTDAEKEQIKAMEDAGNIAGAQGLILDKLGTTVGGVAAAMGGTHAGKMAIFANKISDIKETIGGALLPIIGELMDKYITPLIPKIQEFVEKMAAGFEAFLPKIEAFAAMLGQVINFIAANWQPIVAGIVTFLLVVLVPAFIAWATAAGAAAIATITALAPVLVPVLAIAAVVALLVQAWKRDWGGIRTFLTEVWEGKIKPIFELVKEWLATVITAALQTLSNYWTNVLQPALQQVWEFIQNNIIPIFQAIWAFIQDNVIPIIVKLVEAYFNLYKNALMVVWTFIKDSVIPIFQAIWAFIQNNVIPIIGKLVEAYINFYKTALLVVWEFLKTKILPIFTDVWNFIKNSFNKVLDTLSKLWSDTLLPAITGVHNFFVENILPIFKKVHDFIVNSIGPKIKWLQTVFENLKDALDTGIRRVLDWLLDILQKIKDFLDNFDLPDWLIPGSPTPFERGLRGINEALEGTSNAMDTLSGQLSNSPAFGGINLPDVMSRQIVQAAMVTPALAANPIMTGASYSRNVYMGGVNLNNLMDLAAFDAHIKSVIAGEL